jgi:hypothetical protein
MMVYPWSVIQAVGATLQGYPAPRKPEFFVRKGEFYTAVSTTDERDKREK